MNKFHHWPCQCFFFLYFSFLSWSLYILIIVKFKLFTVVLMTIQVLWVVMPHWQVSSHQCFKGSYWLPLQENISVAILKMIYFSYVHLVMSYGITFWGNSHPSNSIFKIQKRIIKIITNTDIHDSCNQLFKQLQILSLPPQYIFSLLVFVNKNRGLFQSNSEIHD